MKRGRNQNNASEEPELTILGQGSEGIVLVHPQNPEWVLKVMTVQQFNIHEMIVAKKHNHPNLCTPIRISEVSTDLINRLKAHVAKTENKDQQRTLTRLMAVDPASWLGVVYPRSEMDLFSLVELVMLGQESETKTRVKRDFHSFEILVDIAAGIHALHSAGYVHRDLKPENILIFRSESNKGRWCAKLADLSTITPLSPVRTGMVRGTYEYMPPEMMCESDAVQRLLSVAIDIYSFGLLCLFVHNPTGLLALQSAIEDATRKPNIFEPLGKPPARWLQKFCPSLSTDLITSEEEGKELEYLWSPENIVRMGIGFNKAQAFSNFLSWSPLTRLQMFQVFVDKYVDKSDNKDKGDNKDKDKKMRKIRHTHAALNEQFDLISNQDAIYSQDVVQLIAALRNMAHESLDDILSAQSHKGRLDLDNLDKHIPAAIRIAMRKLPKERLHDLRGVAGLSELNPLNFSSTAMLQNTQLLF